VNDLSPFAGKVVGAVRDDDDNRNHDHDSTISPVVVEVALVYPGTFSIDFILTIIAFPIHDTYISSTFGASPYIFLFLEPLLCPNLLYP